MTHHNRGSFTLLLSLFLALLVPLAVLEAQTAKTPDSCSYLTKAEIQEILGQPVQDGKLETRANAAVGQPCQYVVGDYGVFSILVKSIGPGETPEKIRAEFAKLRQKTADGPPVGDKSFFVYPGYGMLQLNTFQGAKYVIMTLMIPGLNEESQKAPAEKLMKKVLPKL
jgi:hypothetical protein